MSEGHEEKKYSIAQIALNLAAACLVSGIIIAITYYITAPVAAKNAIIMKNQAMQNLVKDAEEFKLIENTHSSEDMKHMEENYEAKKGGETIAYVVSSESKGFGGEIKMLVGVTPGGKVIDFEILSHNETPGLGDIAGDESFRSLFKGKGAEALTVVKDPRNKENINALTGATITSRAVTKGVKEAVEKVHHLAGGK
jgi:Na+-translocating ferredoxin:NAD+ oxidoreductase subunit G